MKEVPSSQTRGCIHMSIIIVHIRVAVSGLASHRRPLKSRRLVSAERLRELMAMAGLRFIGPCIMKISLGRSTNYVESGHQ
ncbi:hypothetical protein C8R48DRAFT_212631 [Suillus tomentosus]|nr:hypothetical protein C8R48DRAFT_212631 [Suillus tomentosus]